MQVSFAKGGMRAPAVLATCLLAFCSASVALAQDAEKVLLEIKADTGQKARYSSESTIKLDVAGQQLEIVEKSVNETTVKSVGDDGSVTFERKTVSNSTTMNGQAMPDDGAPASSPDTLTLSRSGKVLAYDNPDADDADPNAGLGVRLLVAGNVIFSDKPVGVGDTWSANIEGNDKLGVQNAKADYELLAFEEVNGIKTAKVKMVFAEASGTPVLKGESTQWIEISSGDVVKSESSVTGISLDLGGQVVAATADSTGSRTAGALVKVEGQETEPMEDLDPIAEKVEDFDKIDGLFTLYRKEDNGRETVYLEVTKDQLNKLVMLQTTASTGLADGRIAAGDPINDLVFMFTRTPNNRVVMMVPNLGFRAKDGTEIKRAVDRSFPKAIVDSFSIQAEHEGRVLLDFSSFFKSDISQVASILQGGGNPLLGGGGNSFSPDRENTYVKRWGNFPTNLYVETVYNFVGRGGGGGLDSLMSGSTTADARSAVMQLNYNMYMLPMDNGFMPRLFDSRVGYFTVDFQDFTKDTALDQKVSYITRWNLQKKDPSAEVSDVVEPITFWIDNAVPDEYRDSVKAAILAWNAPFEEAGFRNAVVAKQMADDAEFDHADMRYNVVRWITSPDAAYAIALFRTNPMTGEILNTSVSIDANIVRAFASEYGDFIRPEAMDTANAAVAKAKTTCEKFGCDMMHSVKMHNAFGQLSADMMAAQGIPGVSRAEYVKQFVLWVVMHEVGHTLGLRHNFVASTELTMEDLKDPEKVDKFGTASSVMDYVAFNPGALNGKARFFGDKPGRYDFWAIDYGYKTIKGANNPEDEKFALSQHASATNQPGLAWLGDEFADSIDPYVTRFDLAGDPMNYWMTMSELSRDLLFKLDQYSPKPGQSFYHFTRDFNVLLGEYSKASDQLIRFIAGVRRSPSYKGDTNEQMPLTPIPGTDQRKALDQVVKMMFAEDSFEFPKEYYRMMAPNPKAGLLESLLSAGNDYPMFDRFADLQAGTLDSLMSSTAMTRLLNQEFEAKSVSETLTLREVLAKATASVWSEVESVKPVGMLRRELQRNHLDRLIGIVLNKEAAPAEGRMLAFAHLSALQKKLTAVKGKVAHESTLLHWDESLARVNRALRASDTVGEGVSEGGGSLLDMLLGGVKVGK